LRALISLIRSDINPRVGFELLSETQFYGQANLKIKYIAFDEDELTIAAENKKHVFKAIVDVSFANENDRKSAERYAFKLFEELID
jgi:hypothetical protein